MILLPLLAVAWAYVVWLAWPSIVLLMVFIFGIAIWDDAKRAEPVPHEADWHTGVPMVRRKP